MRLIKQILTGGLIILICLILLEVLMIITEPYLFTGLYQYDPDMGFRVRPHIKGSNLFRFNAKRSNLFGFNAKGSNRFGFNAKDFLLEKRPNTFRIVIIGDSFNWMGGQDWNYTVFIDKKFQQYFGDDRIDVINVGYPMTHTGEQLVMLKKFALQYNPDLVFLGFFAGNDFIDADPHRKRVVVNDLYFDIDPRHELIIFGYPIVPQSRVICFIQQKIKILKELMQARQGNHGEEAFSSKETFLDIEEKCLQFSNLRLHERGEWVGNINYIFRSIHEMNEILKARNTKFIVGIYPGEFQVNQELLNQIFTKYHLNKEDYDIELTQKMLKGYLDEKGIQCVDLLDKFKDVGKTTKLYKYRDTHWNEAGNKLAADIIFPELLRYVQTAEWGGHKRFRSLGDHNK